MTCALLEMKSFQSTKIGEIDLADIIQTTVELASMKAKDNNITLEIDNQFNAKILADKVKLANVIINLIIFINILFFFNVNNIIVNNIKCINYTTE